MKKLYFIASLFFIIGCARSQISLRELIVKDNMFYRDSSNVFSGYALTKFDSGKISNQILIKDGIPSGEWVSYGYGGEVVQRGDYKPIILEFISIEDLKDIRRINICETNEATESFIDVFIVSSDLKEDVDKTEDKKFRNALVKVLKTKNINIEPGKINKIIGGNIELKL